MPGKTRPRKRSGSWTTSCRSIYILDFIDDPTLRQNVQKALNRGEAYHRMRRAISYVNSGKFRVKTEAEQQIWNECSRLIANAIIYYNTLLLSRVYEQKLGSWRSGSHQDSQRHIARRLAQRQSDRQLRLHDQFIAGRHRSPGSALSKRRLLAPFHDRRGR